MKKIFKIIKKIKLRHLIILLFLLMFNTYAWFIYTTKVNTTIDAHVSSWNVEFISKEGGVESNLLVSVDKIYPGMTPFEYDVNVKNEGEMKAKLDYEIRTIRIMDDNYIVSDTLSSQEIENQIKQKYPFKINIISNDSKMDPKGGTGNFKIIVSWDYESGDDSKDTTYGNKAYQFYKDNPDEKSIEMNLILKAVQVNS